MVFAPAFSLSSHPLGITSDARELRHHQGRPTRFHIFETMTGSIIGAKQGNEWNVSDVYTIFFLSSTLGGGL